MNRFRGLLLGVVVSMALLSGCGGGGSLRCGEGTTEQDGVCVLPGQGGTGGGADGGGGGIIVACGPGTVQVGDECRVDPNPDAGTFTPPPGRKLAAGSDHNCVIVANGSVKCWGDNDDGQLGIDGYGGSGTAVTVLDAVTREPLTGAVHVAAGGDVSCAIVANGALKCWGDNDDGQLGIATYSEPPLAVDVMGLSRGVTSVGLGDDHACAVQNGQLYCWGYNGSGQIGADPELYENSYVPRLVRGAEGGVVSVVAGEEHTCALMVGGVVRCLGDNEYGQLGIGNTLDKWSAVEALLLGGVQSLYSAPYGMIAVLQNGTVKVFGEDDDGELGLGGGNSAYIATESTVFDGGTQFAAGGGHTCFIVGGTVKCAGDNGNGELGDGTTNWSGEAAVTVTGLVGALEVVAGDDHTCALLSGGVVRCWGYGGSGQLGNGYSQRVPSPIESNLSHAVSLALKQQQGCMANRDGGVYCWGNYNGYGNLGSGDTSNPAPGAAFQVASTGGTKVCASQQHWHTCAVISGKAYCFGYNGNGQAGIGNTNQQYGISNPANTPNGETVTDVACGYVSTCAVAGGNAYCFGNSGYGLGNGSTQSYDPVPVATMDGGVTRMISGMTSNQWFCGVQYGGVKCWGWNGYGQLGTGNTNQLSQPSNFVVGLGAGAGVSDLAAGEGHACAVVGGAAKCWGRGYEGQLGHVQGGTVQSPVQVRGLTADVTSIAAGFNHTCAVADGGVYCWGQNNQGQLGAPTRPDAPSDHAYAPISVPLPERAEWVSAGGEHTAVKGVSGKVYVFGNNNNTELHLLAAPGSYTPVTVQGL